MALMENTTNATNIAYLQAILKHWQLSHKSHLQVADAIFSPPQLATDIELDTQGRLWVPVELDRTTDEAYKVYRRVVRQSGCFSFAHFHALTQYDSVWKSGKFEGQKLFKYLRKHGIGECDLNDVTSLRNTNKLWMCLSKNPIDFLFMATHQSFTSCMSLKSDYGGAFYMGFPEMWADQFKYIVFLTNGKLRRYTIKNYEFKHFRMIQRSLAVTNGQKIGLVRDYPSRNTNLVSHAPTSWCLTYDQVKPISKMLATPNIWFNNDRRCQPYNDCYRAYNGYITHTSSGSDMRMRYNNGFENFTTMRDATQRGSCICCDEDLFDDDDYSSLENGERVCDGCRQEYYRWCDNCDSMFHYDDMTYIDAQDANICQGCLDYAYVECEECNEFVHEDYVTSIANGSVCESCRDEHYLYCSACGNYCHSENTYSIGNRTVCEDCIENYKNS